MEDITLESQCFSPEASVTALGLEVSWKDTDLPPGHAQFTVSFWPWEVLLLHSFWPRGSLPTWPGPWREAPWHCDSKLGDEVWDDWGLLDRWHELDSPGQA